MRVAGVFAGAMAMAMAMTTPAAAQDTLIDTTKPAVVAAALRDAGYKAELKTNAKGEPFISSATNGSPFTIEFYGCKGATDCGSMQFYSWYKKDPLYTIALANEWNAAKRFVKVAIDGDGDFAMYMDVTSVGKMTKAAFADWVDWYEVMDAELDKFISGKRGAKK